jgi:thiol-disulfide isomerase/thioredoxin
MQMSFKTVVGIAGAVALGAIIVVGVRQNRPGDPNDVAMVFDAGSRTTLQFVTNPTPLPEMTFQDLDGNTISTRDLKGKVTLVNFWATWCPPCREEIPAFIELQERYGDQLLIIGVSADEGPVEDVRAFAAQYGINYPIVMQTEEFLDNFPGVFALPTTFVLDTDANTVQKHVGLINPAIYELETRVMTGLSTDVTVEYVEDSGQVLLANAAHATEIPGLDLSVLTPDQRTAALQRLNEEECTCGCHLTVAQCRINDASCGISPGIAQRIVDEERLK